MRVTVPPPSSLLLLATAVLLVSAQTDDTNKCPSYKCDYNNCNTDRCVCPSIYPPGALDSTVVPQFVLFTFNKAVTQRAYDALSTIFTKKRTNSNGIRIASTIFVSDQQGDGHGETDYCYTRKLYEAGHDLGSNSKSHSIPGKDWAKASQNKWRTEMIGQRDNMTENAYDLPEDAVLGARAPFLQCGGDKMFSAISMPVDADDDDDDNDNKQMPFQYDSSIVIQNVNSEPQIEVYWPFTLDFKMVNEGLKCDIGKCPLECYPGLWEIPIAQLEDEEGKKCPSLSACLRNADRETINNTLTSNYNIRKSNNRAPLVLNFNLEWFELNEDATKGLDDFVASIVDDEDTFIIPIGPLLDWMRNPEQLINIKRIDSFNKDKVEKRSTRYCVPSGPSDLSFIDPNVLLILEVGGLTLTLLILIARDE